jgi:hypothetical protein
MPSILSCLSAFPFQSSRVGIFFWISTNYVLTITFVSNYMSDDSRIPHFSFVQAIEPDGWF